MLPYFRSMEAFFDLSLPTDWQSLSDSQFQYFFTLLSHDLPMEEILTLCLFKWADLRVLCKTHDGSYLVKQRLAPKQEAALTIRQVQAATASLDFLRQFVPLPVRITKIGRATAIEADFQGVPFSTFISARAFSTPRTRLCLANSPRFCTQRSRSRSSQHRFCSTPSIGFRH